MLTSKIKCEKLAACLLDCAGEEGFFARRGGLRMTVIYFVAGTEICAPFQKGRNDQRTYRVAFSSRISTAIHRLSSSVPSQ
jgi:hypothetical protein